jgi:hypothetical protein
MNKLKFLLLSFLLFTGACSQAELPTAGTASTTGPASQNESAGRNGGGGGGSDKSAANAAAPHDVSLDEADQSKPQPVERKIIRNAELTLETASPEEALQRITAVAESKGGFVVESQRSSTKAEATTRDRVTMTLRIPADKFSETLDEIRKTAGRVIVETVKGQDVTEEFIDIEARLKTKKELEANFLEILKQAKTVQDTLEVQTELSKVRGEIEQIEGKKRFLENQTSLSTIKLILQTPTAFSANSSGFVYQVGRSLSNGFEAAVGFILVFITIIIAVTPFFVLVVLPLYLLTRYFFKRWKKQRLAVKLAKEEKAE